DDGKAVAAVTYDGPAKDKVTLAGASGTTLSNVKAGALTETSTDAVNGAQLFATNKNLKDSGLVGDDGKV
ncbi:hypothetical protein, partial [Burkholderia sp. 3C]